MKKEITSEQVASTVLHTLDIEKEQTLETTTLKQAILDQNKQATIVFVVRRPGCVLCREHARQLSNLSSEIAVLGVVKEVAGLQEFHKEYFNSRPILLDQDMHLYKVMGHRSIFKIKTLFKLITGMRKVSRRMSMKGIEGNLVGDGTIQGGILLFDAKGDLVHVQLENITKEINMIEIAQVLETLIGEEESKPLESPPPRHCFKKGQVCPECI